MGSRASRGDYHLDVRRTGRGDELTLALRDARGEVVYHQRFRLGADEARTVYECLMTALDVALRHDCEHLALAFTPAELADLVREAPHDPRALSPVQAALRRWTLCQLRGFGSVTLLAGGGAPRQGPAVAAARPPLGPRLSGRA